MTHDLKASKARLLAILSDQVGTLGQAYWLSSIALLGVWAVCLAKL